MSVNKFYWFRSLRSSARWLNKMADSGLRLTGVTVTGCRFDECEPGRYEYAVEFVGGMSRERADAYAEFLRECGYKTYFKNINMNVNTGKVVLRPWAEKGARLARDSTTYNRELLIVEKERDGKPFQLHTTVEDRLEYAKSVTAPWLWFFAVFALCAVLTRRWFFAVPAVPALVMVIVNSVKIARLKKEARVSER